jgi:hypothetical protein
MFVNKYGTSTRPELDGEKEWTFNYITVCSLLDIVRAKRIFIYLKGNIYVTY